LLLPFLSRSLPTSAIIVFLSIKAVWMSSSSRFVFSDFVCSLKESHQGFLVYQVQFDNVAYLAQKGSQNGKP
jgi:hypothetical protein